MREACPFQRLDDLLFLVQTKTRCMAVVQAMWWDNSALEYRIRRRTRPQHLDKLKLLHGAAAARPSIISCPSLFHWMRFEQRWQQCSIPSWGSLPEPLILVVASRAYYTLTQANRLSTPIYLAASRPPLRATYLPISDTWYTDAAHLTYHIFLIQSRWCLECATCAYE